MDLPFALALPLAGAALSAIGRGVIGPPLTYAAGGFVPLVTLGGAGNSQSTDEMLNPKAMIAEDFGQPAGDGGRETK